MLVQKNWLQLVKGCIYGQIGTTGKQHVFTIQPIFGNFRGWPKYAMHLDTRYLDTRDLDQFRATAELGESMTNHSELSIRPAVFLSAKREHPPRASDPRYFKQYPPTHIPRNGTQQH